MQPVKRILFVCTGNTCRSPMAAAIWNSLGAGIEAESAGVRPQSSAPATYGAQQAISEIGLDLAAHRARGLSSGVLSKTDLVLTMTARHRSQVVARFPSARAKTFLLSRYVGQRGDVSDPVGDGAGAYCDCVLRLQSLLGSLSEALVNGS